MVSLASIPTLGGIELAPLDVSLLPSTMAVRVPVDSEYGESFGKPAVIRYVRFSRSTEFRLQDSGGAQTGYVFQDGSKGIVYVDAKNSEGAFEVPERSVVTIDRGEPMEVVRVTRCDHLSGAVHHWEVEVR